MLDVEADGFLVDNLVERRFATVATIPPTAVAAAFKRLLVSARR